MMKNQLKDVSKRLIPALLFVKRYAVLLFIIILLGIFGFLVFRINQYSRIEPNEDAIQEKLQSAQRPKVDQSSLNKIQQLQDQNVQVQSLFDAARKNPFNE